MRRLLPTAVLLLLAGVAAAQETKRADVPVADFEAADYGDWTATGKAFGDGPAEGTLPGQMNVEGFHGTRLANSFHGGDGPTGTLTSPPFEIRRPWLNLLVGGGGYAGETCVNLRIDGRTVRTATGPNTRPGGSERLRQRSWDVADLVGRRATLEIVDARSGGWGHVNVDHVVQSDAKAAPAPVRLARTLTVDGSHLIVPVANVGGDRRIRLGIFDGAALVQDFDVALPAGDEPFWLAAYPLASFGLQGKTVTVKPADDREAPKEYKAAFDRIRVGAAEETYAADDYAKPYRNRFHASTRRGWNNDPNGMVFHDGTYHLFYQHNPFGIFWGNMHWGHFTSTDLIHWTEHPLSLFQRTTADMAFSGGGFVDTDGSAGFGKDTLFVAFTSTGRGECLAYSTDGGRTFTELKENPVVRHEGRDPKVIRYPPQDKWVMAVYESEENDATAATPAGAETAERGPASIAFYESTDLHQWTRTGAFTDADRDAVHECPELFELPVVGRPGASRWILYGAQNRYFVGDFDGKTFHKESGPHGASHDAFYAAQTFSGTPDGRRIQVGWVRTETYLDRFPDQTVGQALSLPHVLTLHDTPDGLRVFFNPVAETDMLRTELLAEGKDLTVAEANEKLQACAGELTEVTLEFADSGPRELTIDGIDAGFAGRKVRVFTDRTFNEAYIDDGAGYRVRTRKADRFDATDTRLGGEGAVKSLTVHRLQSIWER